MLEDVDGFVFGNNVGNTITLNDYTYPFTQQLDFTLDDPNIEKRPFTLHDGAQYVRGNLSGMTITVEGDIFADTPEDYFTARQNLVNCLRSVYDPTTYPYRGSASTYFQDGFINIKWLGASEEWTTYGAIYIMAFTAPIRAEAGPSRSPYMITFWMNYPFFTGADTGNAYYIA